MHRLPLVFALVLACAGCASPATRMLERSLIYHPAVYPAGQWDPAFVDYEDAFFQAADGTHLHGWFFPEENPRAVVLFAHGNGGNLTSRRPMLQELRARHHVAVMVFDYRGFGRSEGKPDEAGILQDARAARKWLANRTGVSEQDIVLMGRSLGGGVAVDLAAKDGAQGLVLISTFTSLVDVAKHVLPGIPANWIMTNRLDSLSKIGDYDGPLLQAHGDRDELVPFEYGMELFGAAHSPKQFVVFPGAGHNGPLTEEFHRAFEGMLDSLPVPPISISTAGRQSPVGSFAGFGSGLRGVGRGSREEGFDGT